MAENKTNVRHLGVPPELFDSTSGQNASFVLTWTGDDLTQIDKTVGNITYRKTLVWLNGNLVSISSWVKV